MSPLSPVLSSSQLHWRLQGPHSGPLEREGALEDSGVQGGNRKNIEQTELSHFVIVLLYFC